MVDRRNQVDKLSRTNLQHLLHWMKIKEYFLPGFAHGSGTHADEIAMIARKLAVKLTAAGNCVIGMDGEKNLYD